MKYMVCNCNSYGSIDYGIPLLFHSCDYRTSTGIGLKFTPLPHQEFYNERKPTSKGSPLLEIKDESTKTQYARTYDRKYIKHGEKSNLPLRVPKTHYMRPVKEQMFKNPPPPMKYTIPESKDEYCLKYPEAIEDKIQNIDTQTVCKISSIGRSEQPRIRLEEKGVMKQLDAYVSTNSMSYIPFSKEQIFGAQKEGLTIYNQKDCPELHRIKIRKPINDETKFKKAIKNRVIPNTVYRVPFSGKTSEYNGSYMGPTKGCLYVESMYTGDVTFEDSLSKPPKRQDLAAPNMYCTEYCHIGTGIAVKAAVDTAKYKIEIKHDDCHE